MTKTKIYLPSCASLALILTAGCDAQVDNTYRGEPLATLTGQVEADGTDASGAIIAALLWVDAAGDGDQVYSDEAAVTGTFPAQFSLDIYTPPPANMLNISGEPGAVGFGLAYITALPADFDTASSEFPAQAWGIAANHVVAYVEQDLAADSAEAALLGAALTEGFHLLEVVPADDPACGQEMFACLRPAAEGLATSIAITIADTETVQASIPNVL